MKTYIYCSILLVLLAGTGCKKFLDAKSASNLATPATLSDLQAILDNYLDNSQTTLANNAGSDDYYLVPGGHASMGDKILRDAHVWDANTDDDLDWVQGYKRVFNFNTALDHLEKIAPGSQDGQAGSIRGAALFFRSFHFYQIAQLFAPQYNPATATKDLGIPLRLTADFNNPSERPTVQQTYDRILNDLEESVTLLPATALPADRLNKVRPTRTAAYAMLARVYLQIGNHAKAKQNADLALQEYNMLMDYKTLTTLGANNPFKEYNDEVIFYTYSFGNIPYPLTRIDSTLFRSFEQNDLRRTAFFFNTATGPYFKGSYNGNRSKDFNGIATDEVYLIRAEANARLGNTDEAMADLNTLLEKRWAANSFVPYTAGSPGEALTQILTERRKELINRGTRWSDLRRLKLEPQFAVTLTRVIDGVTYTLPPNDLRYTLLIPQQVIRYTTLQQNPR